MSKKLTLIFMIIFTLLYVFLEYTYNVGLVEFLSSKNTEASVYSHLESLGKGLSAIGLSLFIIKLFSKYKVVAFIILAPLIFLSEGIIFDKIVDNLPSETKAQTYYLAVYRNAVLNGHIENQQIGNAPFNATQKVLIENILLIDKSSIKSSVDNFLYQKVDNSKIDEMFKLYSTVNSKVEPYYAQYAIASKKLKTMPSAMQSVAIGVFTKRTQGIPPYLDLEGFEKELAKNNPSFNKYYNTVLIEKNDKLNIKEFKAGEIPLGLNQSQFNDYVIKLISSNVDKMKIKTTNVDYLPHAHDLIASVVIPPIAMSLSLLSLILNLVSLLMLKDSKVLKSIVVVISLGAIGSLVYFAQLSHWQANPIWKTTLYTEENLVNASSAYMDFIHARFINDKSPDLTQVVQIKSVNSSIDLTTLDKQTQELEKANNEDNGPKIDPSLKVDTTKLNEQGYYGEINTNSDNPYLSKDYK